jgi:hypothetical protein
MIEGNSSVQTSRSIKVLPFFLWIVLLQSMVALAADGPDSLLRALYQTDNVEKKV